MSSMAEGKKQMPESPRGAKVDGEDDIQNAASYASEASTASIGSSSSLSDMEDDAFSSPTSSSGPLSDLSELMAQLPIKRGLSKFYDGKSQSYSCLSRVRSLEDLPKKEKGYRRKMNPSKSYAGGLDSYKVYTLPKAAISKKAPKSYLSRSSFLSISTLPLLPVQESLGC